MSEMTTPARVRSIAKHLAKMSDDDLYLYIEDAYQDIITIYKPKDEAYTERLNRYMAAHMASLNIRRAISQKVSDMQITYADGTDAQGTPYLDEFNRLLDLANGGNGRPKIGLTVV